MNAGEACVYSFERHAIRRTTGTLAKLRTIGGGPAFRKVRQEVIYEAADLGRVGEPSQIWSAFFDSRHRESQIFGRAQKQRCG
jgi:hypothetical protein